MNVEETSFMVACDVISSGGGEVCVCVCVCVCVYVCSSDFPPAKSSQL